MGDIFTVLFVVITIILMAAIRKNKITKPSEHPEAKTGHLGENFPFPPMINRQEDIFRGGRLDVQPEYNDGAMDYEWNDKVTTHSFVSNEGVETSKSTPGDMLSQVSIQVQADRLPSDSRGGISQDTLNGSVEDRNNGHFAVNLRQAVIYSEILKPKYDSI